MIDTDRKRHGRFELNTSLSVFCSVLSFFFFFAIIYYLKREYHVFLYLWSKAQLNPIEDYGLKPDWIHTFSIFICFNAINNPYTSDTNVRDL